MEISPIEPGARLVVEGYGAGTFKVAGGQVQGSMLIRYGRFEPWPVTAVTEVDRGLEALLALAGDVDLVLLGTGARLEAVARDVRVRLREVGVVLEVMTTPAACRTYNVLVAEDRRVAAALIAMPTV